MSLTVTLREVKDLQARFDTMLNKTPGCEKRKEEFRALQKEANALFVKFQESENTSLQQGDLSTRSIASADTAVDSPKPALLKLFQDLKGERKLQSWGIGLTSQESKAMEANLKKLQAKTTGSSTQRSASKSVAQMGDVNPSKVNQRANRRSVESSSVLGDTKQPTMRLSVADDTRITEADAGQILRHKTSFSEEVVKVEVVEEEVVEEEVVEDLNGVHPVALVRKHESSYISNDTIVFFMMIASCIIYECYFKSNV